MKTKKIITISIIVVFGVVAVFAGFGLTVYLTTSGFEERNISWLSSKDEVINKETVDFLEYDLMENTDAMDRSFYKLLISKEKVDYMGHKATLVYAFSKYDELLRASYLIYNDTDEQYQQTSWDIFVKLKESYVLQDGTSMNPPGDQFYIYGNPPSACFTNDIKLKGLKERLAANIEKIDCELTMRIQFNMIYNFQQEVIFDDGSYLEDLLPEHTVTVNYSIKKARQYEIDRCNLIATTYYSGLKRHCDELEERIESLKEEIESLKKADD